VKEVPARFPAKSAGGRWRLRKENFWGKVNKASRYWPKKFVGQLGQPISGFRRKNIHLVQREGGRLGTSAVNLGRGGNGSGDAQYKRPKRGKGTSPQADKNGTKRDGKGLLRVPRKKNGNRIPGRLEA